MVELGKLNFAVAYAGKRSICGFRTIERGGGVCGDVDTTCNGQ